MPARLIRSAGRGRRRVAVTVALALVLDRLHRPSARGVPAAAGRRADHPTRSTPRRARGARATAGSRYAVAAGTPVRAAAAGTVTFSGVVADVRYVVVRHADGLLATYGGLSSTHAGSRRHRRRRGDRRAQRRRAVLRAAHRARRATSTRSRCSASWSCRRTSCRPTARPRRPPPEPVLRCRPV